MTTIEIKVSDDLVKSLGGKRKVEKSVMKELEYQRFKYLEEKLMKAMKKAKGVNWEQEFEKAREEAYKEWIAERKKNGQ